jgi:hypothetical protein
MWGVVDMTRVRNRLHALLLVCEPEYQHRLPSLTTQAGVVVCQHYIAPGLSTLAREREQAVRRLAMQLVLLADQEREIQHKLERITSGRFAPLRTMSGSGALIAAGLIAELGAPRPASAKRNWRRWPAFHLWRRLAPAEPAIDSTDLATAG